MTWYDDLRDLLGLRRSKSFLERWTDRVTDAVESAADTARSTGGRAAEAAGEARRRTGDYLSEAGDYLSDAGERARAQRDALAERVAAIGERAAEIRERRRGRRERRAQRRARARRRATPMQLDVRGDDRIVLRGRRPIDVRAPDGSLIRYRVYERPGFWRRMYLHLTGRQVWPPR